MNGKKRDKFSRYLTDEENTSSDDEVFEIQAKEDDFGNESTSSATKILEMQKISHKATKINQTRIKMIQVSS